MDGLRRREVIAAPVPAIPTRSTLRRIGEIDMAGTSPEKPGHDPDVACETTAARH
jgi:hypothetical protein